MILKFASEKAEGFHEYPSTCMLCAVSIDFSELLWRPDPHGAPRAQGPAELILRVVPVHYTPLAVLCNTHMYMHMHMHMYALRAQVKYKCVATQGRVCEMCMCMCEFH